MDLDTDFSTVSKISSKVVTLLTLKHANPWKEPLSLIDTMSTMDGVTSGTKASLDLSARTTSFYDSTKRKNTLECQTPEL